MPHRKKVIVVGATGMIGSGVAALLDQTYDVIRAARSGGDIRVDTASPASVVAMFEAVGPYVALLNLSGSGTQGSFINLSDEDIVQGFWTKVIAQVRLIRLGLPTIADKGSFTLTSGILSREPHPGFSAIATVNGAVDSFCLGASVEMPRGIRINSVTPVFMTETLAKAGVTNTQYPELSVAETAKAYLLALEGDFTGQVIDARKPLPLGGVDQDAIESLIDRTDIAY
jgi:NAD(P)-dependent dehydrogenase (short-subunit alcohol dehydrogenase family)